MTTLVSVHDPRGYPPAVTGKRLSPRLPSLDGKKLHLVDCLYDNSDVFMQQLQTWLRDNMPNVQTEIIRPRESWVDDPAMRKRIVEEADAAVFGVGL